MPRTTKPSPAPLTGQRPLPVVGPRANSAIATILAAAKLAFLEKGFGGTTMDDIAERAGVSRASVYTYFPSKGDVLLAIGHNWPRARNRTLKRLREIGPDWTVDDLRAWVKVYFEYLDEFGSYTHVVGQASVGSPEAAAKYLRMLLTTHRQLGEILDELRGYPIGDPTEQGALVYYAFQGFYYAWRIRRMPYTDDQVMHNVTSWLEALLRAPRPDSP